MVFLPESALEEALLDQLRTLGYAIEREENIGPDGRRPERESHDEVVLKARLERAVERLNPTLPDSARREAIRRVTHAELPNLLEENRRLHRLLTEGVDVEYDADDGALTAGKVRLIDFDDPANNDWLAVSQFVVINGQVSGPGRLRGIFMKSSGFSAYHLFMASMGGTCTRAFWGMW